MSGIPSRNCDGTQEILDGIRESSSFGPGSEAEVKPRQTLWETPKNRGCMASVSFMDFAASLGGTLDFRNLNTNHKPWFHSYIVCFVIWFGEASLRHLPRGVLARFRLACHRRWYICSHCYGK